MAMYACGEEIKAFHFISAMEAANGPKRNGDAMEAANGPKRNGDNEVSGSDKLVQRQR